MGAPFFNYWKSLENALLELGHKVVSFSYDDSVNRSMWGILKEKLYIMKNNMDTIFSLSDEKRNDESQKVYALYKEFKPDIFLAFGAYFLTNDCLEKIRCKKISWIFDPLSRFAYDVKIGLSLFDFVYTFDWGDMIEIAQYNKSVDFLPLCFDPKVYYPIANMKKTVDISFVGAMDEKRWKMTQAIYKEYPNLKLSFAGVYIKRCDVLRRVKRKITKEGNSYNNKNITPSEANKLYSRSKICLNAHKSSLKVGANIRFFELMGAGAFQLVDSNPYIEDSHVDCMSVYDSMDNMLAKIEYYLTHEKERMDISDFAYHYALKNDTFHNRAKTIMER